MNNTFTPEFLNNVTWNLSENGVFNTKFHVNDKFHLSIITGGNSYGSPGKTYEVALIHTASHDIVTVRPWLDADQITLFAEMVGNQTL